MSKRRKNKGGATVAEQQAPPQGVAAAAATSPPPAAPVYSDAPAAGTTSGLRGSREWVVWMVVVALVLVFGAGLLGWHFWEQAREAAEKAEQLAAEQLVEQWQRLHAAGNPEAFSHLAPKREFGKEPVHLAPLGEMQVDFMMRLPGLKIKAVRKGEPKGREWTTAVPRRFTLVTEVIAGPPEMRRIHDDGTVDKYPAFTQFVNPLLVVEVREGKIHPVRWEVAR